MALGQSTEAQGSPERATLFNLGAVTLIEPPQEVKPSEFSPFVTHFLTIHLAPFEGTSGQRTRFRLRFNPAHLNADFEPSSAATREDLGDRYDAFSRYYSKNIFGSVFGKSGFGPSLLQGICGLDAEQNEIIGEISDRFQADGPVTPEKFYEVLQEALQEGAIGQSVGYILTQQRVNTKTVGPDGKEVWVPGPYMEVGSRLDGFGSGLFYPTPANAKALKKIADKGKGRYLLTFGEDAVPF